MNCRIGREQELEKELRMGESGIADKRNSKDSKLDGNGAKFLRLLDEHGLVVLNGRVKGDSNGELTFIGPMGQSLIDYSCISIEGCDMVESVCVESEIFSDHLPVITTIRMGQDISVGTERDISAHKLRWNKEESKAFKKVLQGKVADLVEWPRQIDKAAEVLENLIRSSARKKKGSPWRKVKVWFNWDCERARRESFNYLSTYRKTNSEIIRQKYYLAN